MGFCGPALHPVAIRRDDIRCVLQVIEPCRVASRRVFELMVKECERLLARLLIDTASAHQVLGLTQQMEHKETLVKPSTIESRQQTARDLLWAASAEPAWAGRARDRSDTDLVGAVARRQGFVGTGCRAAGLHVRLVRQHLTVALMSRDLTMPQVRVDPWSRGSEDRDRRCPDGESSSLSRDAQSAALLMREDAGDFERVDSGGCVPSKAMMGRPETLSVGQCFEIDHPGEIQRVPLAWRSQSGQWLLPPYEKAALTLRVIREVLAQLDVDSERFLSQG